MVYTSTYKSGFLKDVGKLPKDIRNRLLGIIEHICRDPFAVPSRKLFGCANLYRYRLGDYRLVYYIDSSLRKVIFLIIAHRKDVYRYLGKNK